MINEDLKKINSIYTIWTALSFILGSVLFFFTFKVFSLWLLLSMLCGLTWFFLSVWLLNKIISPSTLSLKEEEREDLLNNIHEKFNIDKSLKIEMEWTNPSFYFPFSIFTNYQRTLETKDALWLNIGKNFRQNNIHSLLAIYHELWHYEQLKDRNKMFKLLGIASIPLNYIFIWIAIASYFYYFFKKLSFWDDILGWNQFIVSSSLYNVLIICLVLALIFWIIDCFVEYDATQRIKTSLKNHVLKYHKDINPKLLEKTINNIHVIILSSYICIYLFIVSFYYYIFFSL